MRGFGEGGFILNLAVLAFVMRYQGRSLCFKQTYVRNPDKVFKCAIKIVQKALGNCLHTVMQTH